MKNILCFGDSLTCGYYNNGNNFYPYAHKLQQLLIHTDIDYIGLNGWTTNDMLTEANNPNCIDAIGKIWKGLKCQLLEKKYDYCIILAGTNDLDELENYNINDLFHLHKIVHDSGCKSIALTIPQVKFESADERITLHRNNINNMIIKCNSDLINKNLYTYIDISKKLQQHQALLDASYDVRKSLWDNDGMHLNPNGYDLIANLIGVGLEALALLPDVDTTLKHNFVFEVVSDFIGDGRIRWVLDRYRHGAVLTRDPNHKS